MKTFINLVNKLLIAVMLLFYGANTVSGQQKIFLTGAVNSDANGGSYTLGIFGKGNSAIVNPNYAQTSNETQFAELESQKGTLLGLGVNGGARLHIRKNAQNADLSTGGPIYLHRRDSRKPRK